MKRLILALAGVVVLLPLFVVSAYAHDSYGPNETYTGNDPPDMSASVWWHGHNQSSFDAWEWKIDANNQAAEVNRIRIRVWKDPNAPCHAFHSAGEGPGCGDMTRLYDSDNHGGIDPIDNPEMSRRVYFRDPPVHSSIRQGFMAVDYRVQYIRYHVDDQEELNWCAGPGGFDPAAGQQCGD